MPPSSLWKQNNRKSIKKEWKIEETSTTINENQRKPYRMNGKLIKSTKNLKTSIIGKNECDFSITAHNFFGNKHYTDNVLRKNKDE